MWPVNRFSQTLQVADKVCAPALYQVEEYTGHGDTRVPATYFIEDESDKCRTAKHGSTAMALISEQGHESNGKTHHHHRGQSAAGKRGHLTVRRVTAHRSHLKHTADPSLAPSRQQSNLNAQRDINAVVEGCTKCAPRPIPAMDSRMSGPTLRVEAKTFNKKA